MSPGILYTDDKNANTNANNDTDADNDNNAALLH